jgi:hypothetical protein
MTATQTRADTGSRVVTPTLRATGRRWLFWVAAAVFVVLVAIVILVAQGSGTAGRVPHSPVDPSPDGAKAIAQVLGQRGVDVATPTSFAEARSALEAHGTLFVVDPDHFLPTARLEELAKSADHLVLLSPGRDALAALAPGVRAAGAVGSRTLTASCNLPAAARAGSVSGEGTGYRADPSADATSCFPSGNGVRSVVDLEHDGLRVTVVGTATVFTDAAVPLHGNAALALGLLGDQKHLTWYLPGIADAGTGDTPQTIGELTGAWVTPALILLLITTIAAGFWRGRRLGPLVIERMPVVVRSNETVEGRARLYQRGSARLRALDALRIGAIARLAGACGLPRTATVDDVIEAVAAATGEGSHGIRELLLDADPATDRELVALSDALLDLERRTAAAVHP